MPGSTAGIKDMTLYNPVVDRVHAIDPINHDRSVFNHRWSLDPTTGRGLSPADRPAILHRPRPPTARPFDPWSPSMHIPSCSPPLIPATHLPYSSPPTEPFDQSITRPRSIHQCFISIFFKLKRHFYFHLIEIGVDGMAARWYFDLIIYNGGIIAFGQSTSASNIRSSWVRDLIISYWRNTPDLLDPLNTGMSLLNSKQNNLRI